MKNTGYHWIAQITCLFIFISYFIACKFSGQSEVSESYIELVGTTMGTYYKVTCDYDDKVRLKYSIDSLLTDINSVVSVYEEESYISIINRARQGEIFDSLPAHFKINLERSMFWYVQSGGYLDVSIMPLVNYWGFGYTAKQAVSKIDSLAIDSINTFIGLDKWNIDSGSLQKRMDGQQLDFGAVAKGYAVDEVGDLLKNLGCRSFLIDIGGELVAQGVNKVGNPWVIGISTPRPNARMDEFELLLKLENKSLASSGNYRNYYEIDNRKYGHTMNPKTGYPYQDQLLAVSVITDHCIDADAIATACMAMGYVKATTFISELSNVSACFLVGDETGAIQIKFSNGFIQYVLES